MEPASKKAKDEDAEEEVDEATGSEDNNKEEDDDNESKEKTSPAPIMLPTLESLEPENVKRESKRNG